MRHTKWCWVWVGTLAACNAETGFSKATGVNTVESGAGEIEVTPLEIVFEEVDWESHVSKGQIVTIANVGDNVLQVSEIGLTDNGGGALYCEDVGELNLAPGAESTFSVVVTLDEQVPSTGMLRIRSGDVDEATLNIPITAYPVGYEPDPDTGDTGAR